MATISHAISATEDLLNISATLSINELPQRARVRVDDEVMLVRKASQAGKQLLVIRGAVGSTAAAHASGATIEYQDAANIL